MTTDERIRDKKSETLYCIHGEIKTNLIDPVLFQAFKIMLSISLKTSNTC